METKNKILVYGLFIGMLLFLLMMFQTSSASADYCMTIVDANHHNNSGWLSTSNIDDDNTATTTYCKNDGEWINIRPYTYPTNQFYYFAGIKIYAFEDFRGTHTDFYFNVNIDGTNVGDFIAPKDTWTYINFSQTYSSWYDLEINITFQQQAIKRAGNIGEIEILYYRMPTLGVTELYPIFTDDCVQINPLCEIDMFLDTNGQGCGSWFNVSIHSNATASGDWEMITYNNESSSGNIDNYFNWRNKFFESYNTRYWWSYNASWNDDFDGKKWENKTYYFDTEICIPPPGIVPNPPVITEIENFQIDCWEMVSVPSWYNVSIFWSNFSLYNESAGTYHSWNHSIANGTHFNALYYFDSSSSTYVNMSDGHWMEPYNGYWIYFFDNNYTLRHNYTLPSGGGGDLEEARFINQTLSDCDGGYWNTTFIRWD